MSFYIIDRYLFERVQAEIIRRAGQADWAVSKFGTMSMLKDLIKLGAMPVLYNNIHPFKRYGSCAVFQQTVFSHFI
jgi:hypothetical protein